MTCKNCLHFNICNGFGITTGKYKTELCDGFSDKSEWKHLPCKVGDKAYWIAGDKIQEYTVKGFVFVDEMGFRVHLDDFDPVLRHPDLFFSKEAAKKELAERGVG